jgi:hypothetical protein
LIELGKSLLTALLALEERKFIPLRLGGHALAL